MRYENKWNAYCGANCLTLGRHGWNAKAIDGVSGRNAATDGIISVLASEGKYGVDRQECKAEFGASVGGMAQM